MNQPDGAAIARQVAGLGEYFALPGAAGDDWQPVGALLDDSAAVSDYIEQTRRAMAAAVDTDRTDVPRAVAASSWQLGIAARLLSPVVGSAACFDALPILTRVALVWQRNSTHTPDFAGSAPRWVHAGGAAQAARVIAESLVAEVLEPLIDVVGRVGPLSEQVMRGNIISAANGAVTVLRHTRPDGAARGRDLVRALLSEPALHGTAEISAAGFRRRNCCLYYRVPGGGYCGDCVLTE